MKETVSFIDLAPEYRVSVEEYADIRQSTPHILLDVRSVIQFNMVSLSNDNGSQKEINIPLKDLEKMSYGDIILKCFGETVVDSCICVYTLCRRGIDSVVAAKVLIEKGFMSVKNIDGGLTSWHTSIDPEFPLY